MKISPLGYTLISKSNPNNNKIKIKNETTFNGTVTIVSEDVPLRNLFLENFLCWFRGYTVYLSEGRNKYVLEFDSKFDWLAGKLVKKHNAYSKAKGLAIEATFTACA